jgi:uncharacterized protein YkwD
MRTLRVPALCFVLGACSTLAVPTTTGGSGASSPTTTTPSSSSVATDIVRYTNEHRARNGLPAFVSSPRLMQAAQLHAQQMAQYQRMDHAISGAQYPTLQSRLEAVSYPYRNAAENVGWNSQSAQSAVTGWMNSPGHRANILDPALSEIGAAMVRSAKGEPYWIQVFGTPR